MESTTLYEVDRISSVHFPLERSRRDGGSLEAAEAIATESGSINVEIEEESTRWPCLEWQRDRGCGVVSTRLSLSGVVGGGT